MSLGVWSWAVINQDKCETFAADSVCEVVETGGILSRTQTRMRLDRSKRLGHRANGAQTRGRAKSAGR